MSSSPSQSNISSPAVSHQQQQQQQQHSLSATARSRKRVGQQGGGGGGASGRGMSSSSDSMCLDFRQDGLQFSDVTLLVGPEKQRLRAHRILLSLWSPVFRAMLITNACQEQQSQTINLPEDTPETVELMLRAFYTPGGCEIDYAGALSLLPLVHRLQADQLVRDCEEKLLRNLKDDTVFSALELADRYDLAT